MGAQGSALGQGAGIAASLYGSYQSLTESQEQAKNLIRDSETEALRLEEENKKFGDNQESMYRKSGVTLEGSPLLVLEETRRKGLAERSSMRERARKGASQIVRGARDRFLVSLLQAGSKASAIDSPGGGGAPDAGGSGIQTYNAGGARPQRSNYYG